MGVAITGLAMRGPAGVSNTGVSMKFLANDCVLEFGYLTLFFVYSKAVAVLQSDPRAIIAAVLESFEPFDYNRISLSGSSVTNDSAHQDIKICAPKIEIYLSY